MTFKQGATMKSVFLNIAQLGLNISLNGRLQSLPDNYRPFEVDKDSCKDIVCNVCVTDRVASEEQMELVSRFDDLGFVQEVYKNANQEYLFKIFAVEGQLAATMVSSCDFRHNVVGIASEERKISVFGLNNMLMIAFAFSSAYRGTLMMHSSVVLKDGRGYMFLGKSGTGKSTHSSLWLKYIDKTTLLNDDNPVVRLVGGDAYVYGTPWSGKTPCYKNLSGKVGAIVMLEQKPYNKIVRQSVVGAFSAMMSSCSLMVWDKASYNNLLNTISKLISLAPMYHLQCLPDKDAALLSYGTIGA